MTDVGTGVKRAHTACDELQYMHRYDVIQLTFMLRPMRFETADELWTNGKCIVLHLSGDV